MNTSEMKDYIGTKQIKAKLCTVQEAEDILGWPIRERTKGADKIYLVEYEGGYKTWSPIEPFEKAYRQAGNFDFGMAITLLKQGYCVARSGWNGKGMYLALQSGTTIPVENARGGAALAMANEGFDKIEICSHIDMRSADGKCVVGWLASQTDMLAEDWCIVGGAPKQE